MSALPSASGLHRAFACIASVALPQAEVAGNRYADRGTDKHAFLERIQNGMPREESLALVPEESRSICAAIEVERLPAFEGDSFAAEVAFVYDVALRTAKEVGRSIGRAYPPLRHEQIAGTADVVGLLTDGETVFVADYKGPYAEVAPAKSNAQLKFLALAACRAYDRSRAQVAIIRLRDDGSVWTDSAEFDAFDLDVFAGELLALLSKAETVQTAVEGGVVPKVTLGPWCRYCPAVASCPGQTGLIRAAAGEPQADALSARLLGTLTPETAAAAFVRVKQVEAALSLAKDALHRYAFAHPIALPDGSVYGPVETKRDELAGGIVHAVLSEKYGVEVANLACEFESTKKGVDRAMRRVLEEKKRAGEPVKLKDLNAEALESIRVRGGLTTRLKTDVKLHHVPKT